MGCSKCDGTSNHVGHGGQKFLYKGMNHTHMKAHNISIPNPWSPEPGSLVAMMHHLCLRKCHVVQGSTYIRRIEGLLTR